MKRTITIAAALAAALLCAEDVRAGSPFHAGAPEPARATDGDGARAPARPAPCLVSLRAAAQYKTNCALDTPVD